MNEKRKFKTLIAALIIALGGMTMSESVAYAKPNEMEKRIQTLEDRAAIKELVDTFSVLADQKAIAKQTELFTDDATVQSFVGGKLVSDLKGKKQIGETFGKYLDLFDTVYHINGQQTVEISGDQASGTSYCFVSLIGQENGKRMKNQSGVYYSDKYVKRNGKWLISARVSTFSFSEKTEMK